MPKTIVAWTEAVLARAHVYFALLEFNLRSAQNVLQLVRALKAEGLPHEKLRYVLNRAMKFTDLSAKSRVKRMAESLTSALKYNCPMVALRSRKPMTMACRWPKARPRTCCDATSRSWPNLCTN